MAKHYNSRIKHRDFKAGDLVLRKVMGAAKDPTQGKLGPNWEGLYKDYVVAEERHLPPRDTRRTEVAPSTEHRAPTEVLPVKLMMSKNQQEVTRFSRARNNTCIIQKEKT